MKLHIYQDAETLSRALAEWIVEDILRVTANRDRYSWALTGGNSPRRLYQMLAQPPYSEKVPWNKLHIFWGDERAVPFNDERNNARMTYETLLNKVPVPPDQVYRMRTDISPEKSAEAYEELLRTWFGPEGSSFDLVLNGMGDDGHTLSLFPGTEVIHEKSRWVKAYYLAPQSMYRITLTAPLVNRASRIAFLAFGANKADALHEVLEGERNVDRFPSQIIQPSSGELHWFVDEEAAERLI